MTLLASAVYVEKMFLFCSLMITIIDYWTMLFQGKQVLIRQGITVYTRHLYNSDSCGICTVEIRLQCTKDIDINLFLSR